MPFKSAIDGNYPGRKQEIRAGSYVTVGPSPRLDALTSFTVQVFAWPTTPLGGTQALLSKWAAASHSGFALIIDEQGCAALWIGDGRGARQWCPSARPMLPRRWYRLGAAYDADTKRMRVFQHPLAPVPGLQDGAEVERVVEVAPAGRGAPLLMAALGGAPGAAPTSFYNGKLDSPRLANRALDAAECAAIAGAIAPPLTDAIVANWDLFARHGHAERR